MTSLATIDGLSECIARAIQEHLAKSKIEWSGAGNFCRPIVRFEAFLEDASLDRTSSRSSAKIASTLANVVENTQDATEGDQIDAHSTHEVDIDSEEARRRGTGGLRIALTGSIQEDVSEHQRQMQSDNRAFPKRRKIIPEKFVFQPSTLDKLIIGIWEQFQISSATEFGAIQHHPDVATVEAIDSDVVRPEDGFSRMNLFCRKITQASRVCRSIEIIVQARWVELFDEQVQLRFAENPQLSSAKHRRAAFMEACNDFSWPEKELRNKMAIWRGYQEIKEAAGWAALVFAGMGIYRFCKYRVRFDSDAMRRLRNIRNRLEVAADTLHPNWRQLLSIIGERSTIRYEGHPHDWVVSEDGSEPVPLRSTYAQTDPFFRFEHIEESVIDEAVWGCDDPRWLPNANTRKKGSGAFVCAACGEEQSDDLKKNSCYCFPRLFGCAKRKPAPVQVIRTPNRNNGLMALAAYERGGAVGEFVGQITKGKRHLDVMDSATPSANYQIWQGNQGNYTRFVNHSCKANAQFQQFNWLDTQRVVLVSKGIEAGMEITVDYSDRYWSGLDKKCLSALHINAAMRTSYRSKAKPAPSYSDSDSQKEVSGPQHGSRKRRKLTISPTGSAQPDSNGHAPSPATMSRIRAKGGLELGQMNAEPLPSDSAAKEEQKATFSSLNVAPWLVASLASMEIKKPTAIQQACIPEILKGRDCLGASRTGTGKTVAFAVPIMQKWASDPCGNFAVILTPTRELAIQIWEQFKAISAPQSMKPLLVTGGADQLEQTIALEKRPHVIIATPGRLADLIENSGEDITRGLLRVQVLVLDEADRLLAPGRGSMLPDLETILSALPPPAERQTLLFTATVTNEVRTLKEKPPRPGRPPMFVHELDIEETIALPPKLKQTYIQTPVTHKECYLHVLLLTPEIVKKSVIIFCNQTKTADLLERLLRKLEHRVTALHSGLRQPDRTSNLARYRAQAARILVATDVASRGLDIPEVALVVNYDVPRDPDDYIHRVGRTARAGRAGLSVTLIGQRDVDLIYAIEDRVNEKMVEYEEEGVNIETRVVRDAIKPVTEKKREALMQIEENKDIHGKRRLGIQKLKKVED
ncbi:DEAD-domain-containing protein [Polyplosphaeria fusca]|uniref:DEAD-domain-containing protein n=1 Tax=Polyplosphaeria fusca TaxID=682080 RepID=A0A9P4R866_9PLEO|nr:DEAD-domain-containing protein [Polyplosphaeria fusca]